MAVFEDGYKEDLTKEEGMELVARAIRSGIYNDLGSGSNVDLCIITKDGVRFPSRSVTVQGQYHRVNGPICVALSMSCRVHEKCLR